MKDVGDWTLQQVKDAATMFRKACRVGGPFTPAAARSLSLEEIIQPASCGKPWLEIATPWKNEWFALDQVGAAMQAFAQTLAHDPAKLAFGLPRQIDGPRPTPLPHQTKPGHKPSHKPPTRLISPKGQRHAAPIQCHLARTADGTLIVRVTAMVARSLPNESDSRKRLGDLVAFLQNELVSRVRTYANQGTMAPVIPAGPQLKQSQKVKAKVSADDKGKGRAFAEIQGRKGIIEGVPAGHTLTVGDEVELVIKVLSVDGKQITFKWPV